MIEENNPDINVNDLMKRVRDEVAKRKVAIILPHTSVTLDNKNELIRQAYLEILGREPDEIGLNRFQNQIQSGEIGIADVRRALRDSEEGREAQNRLHQPSIYIPEKMESSRIILRTDPNQKYSLNDLLSFHDVDFIRNSYRKILSREPDSVGFSFYLSNLRNGKFSKIELLGRIRYSREGIAKKVYISNLFRRYLLKRILNIPLLGFGISVFTNILRLPIMQHHLQRTDAEKQQIFLETNQKIQNLTESFGRSLSDLQKHLLAFSQTSADKIEKLKIEIIHLQESIEKKADLNALTTLIEQIQQNFSSKADISLVNEIKNQFIETVAKKVDSMSFFEFEKWIKAQVVHSQDEINAKVDAISFAEFGNRIKIQLAEKANITIVEDLENRIAQGLSQKADHPAFVKLEKKVESDRSSLSELHELLSGGLTLKAEMKTSVNPFEEYMKKFFENAANEIGQLHTEVIDNKRNLIDQQRRITILFDEIRKRMPAKISHQQMEKILVEEDNLLDSYYVTLEDRFRGTRKDIKRRSEIYLPVIQHAKAGTEKKVILDIGCGRGEFLELLREQGLIAKGIDLNRVMVDQCRDLDLDVVEAEAISYLREQKENSVGAVTGMHIIEHFPLKSLISLFDEVLRVLQPGGVVTFETPNPENLIVGACTFYLDPTHQKPMPPVMTQFLIEQRGFVHARIERLKIGRIFDPFEKADKDTEANERTQIVFEEIRNRFFGAPDYAIIAYKA